MDQEVGMQLDHHKRPAEQEQEQLQQLQQQHPYYMNHNYNHNNSHSHVLAQSQQQVQPTHNSYSHMNSSAQSTVGGNGNGVAIDAINAPPQWQTQFAAFAPIQNGQNIMFNPAQAWGAASMQWQNATAVNGFQAGVPNSVPVNMANTNTQRLVNHLNNVTMNNSGSTDTATNMINVENVSSIHAMSTGASSNMNGNVGVNNNSQPIYVNAKQYRRILKRREARALLDEYFRKKKLAQEMAVSGDESGGNGSGSSSKRSYTHESRHRHAMKRPRGPGGRFLTKNELEGYYAAHPEEAVMAGYVLKGTKENVSQGNDKNSSLTEGDNEEIEYIVDKDMSEVQWKNKSSNRLSNHNGESNSEVLLH